jgi:hypothetical protein
MRSGEMREDRTGNGSSVWSCGRHRGPLTGRQAQPPHAQ